MADGCGATTIPSAPKVGNLHRLPVTYSDPRLGTWVARPHFSTEEWADLPMAV